jgi:hypothetical protein
MIKLDDDGCSDTVNCSRCHKPCDPASLLLASFNHGATWAPASLPSNSASIGAGGIRLSDTEYLVDAGGSGYERNASLGTFVGAGRVITLLGNASFGARPSEQPLVFAFGQDGPGAALFDRATAIIRWCLPSRVNVTHMGEVVQVEMSPPSTDGAALGWHGAVGSGPGGRAPALPSKDPFMTPKAHRGLAFFISADNYTWTYAGAIASSDDHQFDPYTNKPCEPAFVALANGTLLTVFRVDSFAPYYTSQSDNGGRTWSRPRTLGAPDMGSVRPRLATYGPRGENILLIGGREGLMAWTTSIDAGGIWRSVNLAEAHNAAVQAATLPAAWLYPPSYANRTRSHSFSVQGSTSYTSLIEVAPSEGRFTLLYDHLAQGWLGPGPGQADYVFVAQLETGGG